MNLTEVPFNKLKPEVKKRLSTHWVSCKSLCKNGWCTGCGFSESVAERGCYYNQPEIVDKKEPEKRVKAKAQKLIISPPRVTVDNFYECSFGVFT